MLARTFRAAALAATPPPDEGVAKGLCVADVADVADTGPEPREEGTSRGEGAKGFGLDAAVGVGADEAADV